MIRYVVWDVDGALLNTYPAMADAFTAALGEMGGYADFDQIERLVRMSWRYGAQVLAERNGLDDRELSRRAQDIYQSKPAASQPPLLGVVAVCDYVHGIGGACYAMTSRYRAELDNLLQAHGLQSYIDEVLTAEDGLSEPREMVDWIVESNYVPRDEVLVVCGKESSVLAAQAAGVYACCLQDSPAIQAHPDWVVRDAGELLAYLCWVNLDQERVVWQPGPQPGYRVDLERLLHPVGA